MGIFMTILICINQYVKREVVKPPRSEERGIVTMDGGTLHGL